MITRTIFVEGLIIISLALSSAERWQAARSSFKSGVRAEGLLACFAVLALIVSEILLFYVFNKNKRSEEQLNKKVNDLTITNVKMRQEKEKINQEIKNLKKEVAELTAANEKLRKESAQLTPSV
jgi:uncharacterized protein YlxW (UPF0749 family)